MLICSGCGETFPPESLKRVVEPHGEAFYVCPVCGDTAIEAMQCHCGDWHDPEDLLSGGYCEACLSAAFTRELAEEYIQECGEWEKFLIDFWLNGREYMVDFLTKYFHGAKSDIEQRDLLVEYVLADKWGALRYAAWLEERGGSDA